MAFRDSPRVNNPRRGILAGLTADQLVANGALATLSGFTPAIDTDGFYSGAAPTRFTVPAGLAGMYLVAAYVTFSRSTAGRRLCEISKNGVEIMPRSQGPAHANAVGSLMIEHTAAFGILPLVAGDFLSMLVLQASGGNLIATAAPVPPEHSVFSMFRISL